MALEKVMSTWQEGIVNEYCDEFRFLFNQVRTSEEISEDYATYFFIFGLKQEIGETVMRYHNWGKGLKLDQAFSLARLQERGMNLDSNQEITTDQSINLDVSNYVFQHSTNSVVVLVNKDGSGSQDHLQSIEVSCAPKMFDEMPSIFQNETDEFESMNKIPDSISEY
ncbi:hypothetical protein E3N88_31507 [Mikania micrantha]|uniref:Uncharacterized protein n=1 Tax=Mikania micrantha TaxID=192012 RepID=A0A5N6MQ31_9ASTR|nr:hypothetical protein E3N88_31507 [Mikania micrantha]